MAEVDALETSGGEVVRAERLGEDAGAVAEHHLEVLEGVVARVADGDLDRRDPPWLSAGASVRLQEVDVDLWTRANWLNR